MKTKIINTPNMLKAASRRKEATVFVPASFDKKDELEALVLKNTECDFELRLSALLHDIGKPFCYVIGEDKVNHYPNHGEKSFEISSHILKRLGIENERILYLIRYHDEEIDLSKIIESFLHSGFIF